MQSGWLLFSRHAGCLASSAGGRPYHVHLLCRWTWCCQDTCTPTSAHVSWLSCGAACAHAVCQALAAGVWCECVPHPQHGCCSEVVPCQVVVWQICLGLCRLSSLGMPPAQLLQRWGPRLMSRDFRNCLKGMLHIFHVPEGSAHIHTFIWQQLNLAWCVRAHALLVLQALCTSRRASQRQQTAASVPLSTSPTAMQVSSLSLLSVTETLL